MFTHESQQAAGVGFPVRVELQTQHQPAAPYRFYQPGVFLLQLFQAFFKQAACRLNVPEQTAAVAGQHLQYLQPDPAGQRIAGKSGRVLFGKIPVKNRFRADHGADRHQPASQRLGQEQNIRGDIFRFAGKQGAGPAQPGLDLVQDQQHLVLRADLFCCGQVTGWRYHYAALALDRLYDKGGEVTGSGGQLFCQGLGIAEGYIMKILVRDAKCFLVIGVAGSGEGTRGLAVETVFRSQDAPAPGSRAAQFYGCLHRFGAAVGKCNIAQPVRRQFHQSCGQLSGRIKKGGLNKVWLTGPVVAVN